MGKKQTMDDILTFLGFKNIVTGKIKKICIEDFDESDPIVGMFDTGKNIKRIGKGLLRKKFMVELPRYRDRSEPPNFIDNQLIEIRYSLLRALASRVYGWLRFPLHK